MKTCMVGKGTKHKHVEREREERNTIESTRCVLCVILSFVCATLWYAIKIAVYYIINGMGSVQHLTIQHVTSSNKSFDCLSSYRRILKHAALIIKGVHLDKMPRTGKSLTLISCWHFEFDFCNNINYWHFFSI